VILAKNSDRPPNEPQVPVYVPRTRHSEATVRCTHVEITQVPETFAVLLSKPFWMWGCEMGVNEFGVAIGNEAVFTKEPVAKTGLLGMDLIRLGLERGDTARRALEVIVGLIETYGQGGACYYGHKGKDYHSSFLIADLETAWVLETAGRYWAAKQIDDVYSISNGLTLGSDWDLASEGLVEHAIEKRWCRSEADFHFARCYSDLIYTHFSASKARRRSTSDHLAADCGRITPSTMFSYLRDHGAHDDDPSWTPDRGGVTVCKHAANGLIRMDQSTASLVADLRADLPVYWMTGTSAPCTGLFKPLYFGPLPDSFGEPRETYDAETLWWRHERLHRAVLADYATRMSLYSDERDGLEAAFVAEEGSLYDRHRSARADEHAPVLTDFSRLCLDRAAVASDRWEARVKATPVGRRPGFFYRRYWKTKDRAANFAATAST
jgi:dipeptidase